MTTKLVSMNLGCRLTLEVDGKGRTIEFSAVIPTHIFTQPRDALSEICDFLNENFGTEYICYDSATVPVEVKIAKPRKIKAARPVSQKEFTHKVKELGY